MRAVDMIYTVHNPIVWNFVVLTNTFVALGNPCKRILQ